MLAARRETGSQNTDGTVFRVCGIPNLIGMGSRLMAIGVAGRATCLKGTSRSKAVMFSKGGCMFNTGNLQSVGSTPRREAFHGEYGRLAWSDGLSGDSGDRSSGPRSLLNCMLNLAKLLAENTGNNLSPKQIDYAQTIYTAGTQLLAYIDLLASADVADVTQPARGQAVRTYHGPRSRSDDGGVLVAGSDVAASSGRRRSMPELVGKKVLIVDDDILSVYVMTGALEQQGMTVMHADSGLAGLDMLRAQVDTDAVIVGSSRQAQDNHELIGAIRGIPSFRSIPVIAVTPGNAHGDRDECPETCASDTIDKPINAEQLLSLMRVWLTRA